MERPQALGVCTFSFSASNLICCSTFGSSRISSVDIYWRGVSLYFSKSQKTSRLKNFTWRLRTEDIIDPKTNGYLYQVIFYDCDRTEISYKQIPQMDGHQYDKILNCIYCNWGVKGVIVRVYKTTLYHPKSYITQRLQTSLKIKLVRVCISSYPINPEKCKLLRTIWFYKSFVLPHDQRQLKVSEWLLRG